MPLVSTELPIPAPAQGEVLDLSFGDLDGDMLEELLVLHPGELLVVRDGVTSSTFAVDPLADEVTALHIDGDAALDVFLSSVVDDHAAVLLGIGDGTLTGTWSSRSTPATSMATAPTMC